MLLSNKKLLGIYRKNRFFFNLIVALFTSAFIIDLFIENNMIFLTGEFIFSFDYFGHIKNLTTYLFNDPYVLVNSTVCEGCYDFYHYSRWYALFNFIILAVGNILGLNPFIFYIFSTIIIQLTALYVFIVLIFKKFSILPFIVASVIFIAFPYKYALLASGSFYGFHHAFFILALTFLIYALINFEKINLKHLLLFPVLFGIFSSFFLNMSIGYLPIFMYTVIFVLLFFWRKLKKKLLKILLFLFTSGFLVIITNLPMLISFFLKNESPIYQNYISLGVVDSLTAHFNYFQTLHSTAIVFFALIGILLLRVINKKIVFLLLIYLLVALILMGENSPIHIYDSIFRHVPFMSTIRSLHRFIFFELLILFILSYLGLQSFLQSKKINIKFIGFVFCVLLLLIPLIQIYKNRSFVHAALLPKEYFEVDNFFEDNNESKIYFPSYMPLHNSISGNYIWLAQDPVHQTSHRNPFTSLFALPNLIHFEGYPPSSIENYELRSLTYYKNTPELVVSALEYAGIKYLIVDLNYKWSENFPNFNIGRLVDTLTPKKKFGNIYIYRLEDKSNDCIKSYGNFRYGYCFDRYNPKIFIDRTKEEYILDEISRNEKEYLISNNSRRNFYSTLRNPNVQESVLEKGILIPFDVYQAAGEVEDLYTIKLKEGKYNIFIPILSISDSNSLFGDSMIVVRLDGKPISEIGPEDDKNGMVWNKIGVEVLKEESNLTVSVKGNGFVVVGHPILLPLDNWLMRIDEFNPEIETLENLD